MTVLALEAAHIYFANAEIVGGILPNLIAFGLLIGSIGYLLLTGPLFRKGKRMDTWPTVEAASRAISCRKDHKMIP